MTNSEVLELKKRFRKDKATFYRVTGCYVNEKKEKIYTFNKSFATIPEDEMFKYLEIATKSLSGKINNNLLNLEFPIEEEKDGGAQRELYDLRNSEADDENLLNQFYDRIIQSYQYMNNFVIVLFFDQYDVPVKAKDDVKLEDSEEVFHYFIGTVCPVELTQPNLGFIDKDTGLAITARDLVVRAPETGFMFPAFNNRTTDIHSVLFYTKNAQAPHIEIIDEVLGCDYVLTSAQKKTKFNEIIAEKLSDKPEDEISNIIVDAEYRLKQMIDLHKAEHGEMATLRVKEDVIREIVDDISISDEEKDDIVSNLCDIFDETNTDASILVSPGNLRVGEARAEKKIIAKELAQKEQELSKYKKQTIARKYEIKNINGTDYMLVPTDRNTVIIDGVEYALVLTTDIS